MTIISQQPTTIAVRHSGAEYLIYLTQGTDPRNATLIGKAKDLNLAVQMGRQLAGEYAAVFDEATVPWGSKP